MKKFLVNLALTAVVIFGGFIYLYLQYLQTPEEGTGQITNQVAVKEQVTVAIDDHGIANINANNDDDLYFAMGWMHAKDRLWQLEVQRRIGAGRSAEVFGKTAARTDAWIRALGLTQAAEKALPHLSAAAVASLQAYSDGINSYIKNNELPFEFKFFDVQPEPWTVLDSLTWSKVFAMNLAGNFRNELQRQTGLRYLSGDQMALFFPQDNPKTLASVEPLPAAQLNAMLDPMNQLELDWQIGGKNVGSNAWVVSGKHTDSGAPILANDPHLGLQIPSLWYAVKQTTPNREVAGMSLVGLPVVIFGRNQHIAWGGTNMMADVQDLMVHQTHPQDPNQYRIGGQWKPFKQRVEKIQVKADFPAGLRNPLQPVEVNIRESDLGPVVSDHVPGMQAPMSLRWVALDDKDTTYESFYLLNRATDWQSFLAATAHHVAPALNLFYADKANNIGFKAVGRIPKRIHGDGTLPFKFSEHPTATDNWFEYIPFQFMPGTYNPPSGFLYNANNANVQSDYPYVISKDFAHPARGQRIEQLLSEAIAKQQKITTERTMQMQVDTLDLSALPLLAVMKKITGQTPQQSEALKHINAWNGSAEADSIAPSIYYTWLYHLKKQLFSDELQGYWNGQADKRSLSGLSALVAPESIARLLSSQSVWCNDVATEATESCDAILQSALGLALDDLTSLYGDDVDDWLWGEAQQVVYRHIPFSNMKVFDNIFERRAATGGAPNALHAATSTFNDQDGFETVFGAGFRQVMQMSAEQQHYLVNSTGQSAQLASEHYDDMVDKFKDNAFIDLNNGQSQRQIRFIPATGQE